MHLVRRAALLMLDAGSLQRALLGMREMQENEHSDQKRLPWILDWGKGLTFLKHT